MHAALLVVLALTAQVGRDASMEFQNATAGQTVTIWVWCYEHKDWANDSRPVVLGDGQPLRVNLHTGNFRLFIDNPPNARQIKERVLAPDEVDQMRIDAGGAGGFTLVDVPGAGTLEPAVAVRPDLPAAGGRPSMEFRNQTDDQTATIWVWCYSERNWDNNRRPLVVRPNRTVNVPLHVGNFRLYVRNQNNYTEVKERILAAGEVDRMRIALELQTVGAPAGGSYRGARRTAPFQVYDESSPE